MLTNSNIEIKSGRDVARYFLFLEREKDLNFGNVLFKNISAKRLYSDHSKIFEKFFNVSEKYKIDRKKYISFFTLHLHKTEKSIDSEFLNVNTLNQYCDYLKINQQYNKIYKYFNRSIKNIVNECKELGISDVRQYIKLLVVKNKLAEKFISGIISQYFIASIGNIDKLVGKMNEMNQLTLKKVLDRREKLSKDLQDAFFHFKQKQVNVIEYANQQLEKNCII